MALADEVTSRLSTQRLVNLTNPDVPGPTTVDAARLAAAAADAQAEFEARVGVAYDNSVAMHIMAGVEGVVYYLLLRAGNAFDGLSSAERRWAERLEAVGFVTGNDRVRPTSSSKLTPSDELDGAGLSPVRPDFDRANLGGYQIEGAQQRDHFSHRE